ncbi:KDEL motif-containing protein 1-like [Platysternon megacephalum]|uniref:KDEL motif-containing protein 1-like n=1 Tax=Platysternon megacephalum TaxID=55544 RepID=A0A4D9DES9_9SAUR|nr:KDEL motif-containing protein 1-like [Platysternon megacephalum]
MLVLPPALTEEEEALQKKFAKLKKKAKMLVKTGAISAIKAENKNCGFKRSRTLEGKLKGNTVYVYGTDMTQTLLRGAFSPFGTIIDLSMDNPRK